MGNRVLRESVREGCSRNTAFMVDVFGEEACGWEMRETVCKRRILKVRVNALAVLVDERYALVHAGRIRPGMFDRSLVSVCRHRGRSPSGRARGTLTNLDRRLMALTQDSA